MFDTATARRMMVDGQVRTADVTNLDLIAAMLAVPRELFVPPALAGQAYLDSDIAIGDGRALLKPMVLAKLIQAAQVGRRRSRARCRLRHRLFLRRAGAACRIGGRARRGCRLWRSRRRQALAAAGAGQVRSPPVR